MECLKYFKQRSIQSFGKYSILLFITRSIICEDVVLVVVVMIDDVVGGGEDASDDDDLVDEEELEIILDPAVLVAIIIMI